MTGSEEVAAPLFKFRPQCSIRSLAATDRWDIANFSLRLLCCEHVFRPIRIFLAVLRIRDILSRIRIRGSVPLTPDPDPAIFVSDLQDGN
jgi:hypothetical protein